MVTMLITTSTGKQFNSKHSLQFHIMDFRYATRDLLMRYVGFGIGHPDEAVRANADWPTGLFGEPDEAEEFDLEDNTDTNEDVIVLPEEIGEDFDENSEPESDVELDEFLDIEASACL